MSMLSNKLSALVVLCSDWAVGFVRFVLCGKKSARRMHLGLKMSTPGLGEYRYGRKTQRKNALEISGKKKKKNCSQ